MSAQIGCRVCRLERRLYCAIGRWHLTGPAGARRRVDTLGRAIDVWSRRGYVLCDRCMMLCQGLPGSCPLPLWDYTFRQGSR